MEKLKWIKLDNAATIYPSTLSRKYAAMFRMTVTLNEKVDKVILNKALKKVIKRFPSFRCELKQGLFWCYFKLIEGAPIIQNDYQNPMLRINFKENKGFMFRIRYFDSRIAIEYFHALTDGTGGITFLLTLVGEYLRLKHKINIKYNNIVIDPNSVISSEEYSDSFKEYSRNVGRLEHETPSYHYKGTNEEGHIINIITGIIPIQNLKEESTKYNVTITEFIVSLMILSLQEISKKDHNKKPIKVSIPVNLRNIYKSNTLRNFSSYVNVGIDPKYGYYSFEEIIKEVKSNMKLMLSEKRLNSKITANVKLSNNYFIRLIPMFIKKYILSLSEKLMGDRYCTTTLSNLGLINIPKGMQKYIDELGFVIGKSRGKPGSVSCVGFNDKLFISFSRKIKEKEFERIFFNKLIEMNIPVEIESNGR